MPAVDREAPLRFLRTAYEPDDWVAVFLKSFETGSAVQRVGPLSLVGHPRFQAWLRAKQATEHANVYISVNPVRPGQRSRTRTAIRAIRHLFLEADHDAAGILAAVGSRADLPPVSYVLHSSPNRAHLFWRVSGFTVERAEALQKHLARELRTDPAATPCTQTTRWVGFANHKYRPGHFVTIEYRCLKRTYTPGDFPAPSMRPSSPSLTQVTARSQRPVNVLDRARRYLSALPPAVAGQHGDLHTFRVCCRVVRGFALDDTEALMLLADWNARCEPPWSEHELIDKLRRARRYGREPVGGLLEAQP
jgi:hypothetical protein